MRKIRDILRLRHEVGLSYRDIANALNIGYGTVVDYLARAALAGLGWPIPEELGERELGRLLFPTQAVTGQRRFVVTVRAIHIPPQSHHSAILKFPDYVQISASLVM